MAQINVMDLAGKIPAIPAKMKAKKKKAEPIDNKGADEDKVKVAKIKILKDEIATLKKKVPISKPAIEAKEKELAKLEG